jgi:hypothetical protein
MLLNLSYDILECIIEHISYDKNECAKTLLSLACVNKELSLYLNNAHPIWHAILKQYNKQEYVKLPIKRCLVMQFRIGCSFCGNTRIRKIYPEFGFKACMDCVQNATICGYRLKKEFEFPIQKYTYLPHTTKDFWNSKLGTYTLEFYLLKDIKKILKTKYNVNTLDEYYKNIMDNREKEKQNLLQKKIEERERKKEHKKQEREKEKQNLLQKKIEERERKKEHKKQERERKTK